MVISKEQHNSIEITVEKLRNKEVVIIPTDTVYGFSGIAPWTEDSIRQIKGREENKPFIQLIASPKDFFYYTDEKIDEKILSLLPAPLTIIVPQKAASYEFILTFTKLPSIVSSPLNSTTAVPEVWPVI